MVCLFFSKENNYIKVNSLSILADELKNMILFLIKIGIKESNLFKLNYTNNFSNIK